MDAEKEQELEIYKALFQSKRALEALRIANKLIARRGYMITHLFENQNERRTAFRIKDKLKKAGIL